MGETTTTGLWDENSAAWHDKFTALQHTFHHGIMHISTPTICTEEMTQTTYAEPPTPLPTSSYVPSQALETIAVSNPQSADYVLQANRTSYPSAIATGIPLSSSAGGQLGKHESHDLIQANVAGREELAVASTSNTIDTHIDSRNSTLVPASTLIPTCTSDDYPRQPSQSDPGKDPGGKGVEELIYAEKRNENHNHLPTCACETPPSHPISGPTVASCSTSFRCAPHLEAVPDPGKDPGRENAEEASSSAYELGIQNHPRIYTDETHIGHSTSRTVTPHNMGDMVENNTGDFANGAMHTGALPNPGKDPGGEDASRYTVHQGGNPVGLPICACKSHYHDSTACETYSAVDGCHSSGIRALHPDALPDPGKDPGGHKNHPSTDLAPTPKGDANFSSTYIRSLPDPGADGAPSDLGHKHTIKLYNKASVNGAYERWKAHRRVHIVLPMVDTPVQRRGEGKVRFAMGMKVGTGKKKLMAMTMKEDASVDVGSIRGKSDSLCSGQGAGDERGEEKEEDEVRTGSAGEFDLENVNIGNGVDLEVEEEDEYEDDDRGHLHHGQGDMCCWTSPVSMVTDFNHEDLDDEATSSSEEDEGERSLSTSVSGCTSLSASRASLSLSPELFTCNIPELFSGEGERDGFYDEEEGHRGVEDLWGSGAGNGNGNGNEIEQDGKTESRRTNSVRWAKDVEDAQERTSNKSPTVIEHEPVWLEEGEDGPLSPLEGDGGAFFKPLSFYEQPHHVEDGVTAPCIGDLDHSPQRDMEGPMRTQGSGTGNISPAYIEREPGGQVGPSLLQDDQGDGLASMSTFMDAFPSLPMRGEELSNYLQPRPHPRHHTSAPAPAPAPSPSPPPPQSHPTFDLAALSNPPSDTQHSKAWSLHTPEQGTAAGDGGVPASPSRRRSRDLPGLEEDLNIFGDQELDEPSLLPMPLSEQNQMSSMPTFSASASMTPELNLPATGYASPRTLRYLSLPGAETDDELIPHELAPHNYIPHLAQPVPTAPSADQTQGALLLWGIDGQIPKANRRSCGFGLGSTFEPGLDPDSFYLDPRVLANLPNDAEARKVYDMRQRHRFGALNSLSMNSDWEADKEREREKAREMADLLRLKLGLDAYGAPTEQEQHRGAEAGVEEVNHNAPGVELSNGMGGGVIVASSPTSTPAASHSPPPPPLALARVHHKPTIASMDQLVANMVFHRQHDAVRRKPSKSRTWSPPALVPGPASDMGAEESKEHNTTGAATIPGCNKGMLKTPRSPLRQMLLAEDMENIEDDGNPDEENGDGWLSMATLVESPGPLSPLYLYGKLDV